MHYEVFIPAVILFLASSPFHCKRYGLNIFKSILLMFLLIFIAVLGTKILYIIENYAKVRENGIGWKGGFSLYGAFFTTTLLFPLVGLAFKLKINESLDIASIPLALMIAFFRINCYLEGCCGSKTFYDANGNSYTVPLQLIEMAFVLILTVFLIILKCKNLFKNYLFNVFLIIYGIYRFIIEFFRCNDYLLLHLTNAQIYSIVFIVFSVVVMLINFKEIKENNHKIIEDIKHQIKIKKYRKSNK